MQYLHPNKKTTHVQQQEESRKIAAETNTRGNKVSTRTNAFHQLLHQRQQPRTKLLSLWQQNRNSVSTSFTYYYEGRWHFVPAGSCSASTGVKRIYVRMPNSRTKASTWFAAAVPRRISGVEKYIPRSSTACFRRRHASVSLGQTSKNCSTASGFTHWSQSPPGLRPICDKWWFSWQWPVPKRKIIVERECVDREDRSRAGKITLYTFPLISVRYWISHAWKECWHRYGSISVKFNRVFTRL